MLSISLLVIPRHQCFFRRIVLNLSIDILNPAPIAIIDVIAIDFHCCLMLEDNATDQTFEALIFQNHLSNDPKPTDAPHALQKLTPFNAQKRENFLR